MAFDAHLNFAYSTVVTAPSPATSGTTLTVASGEGARFPTGSWPLIICPPGVVPTPLNAEICRASRSGDVLTLTRAQEGTSARTVLVGDQVFAGITAKTITDIEAATGTAPTGLSPTAVKTTNYIAVVGDFIPVDTTAGNVTITLPNAPADTSQIGVQHVIQGGTNKVTINRAGSDVFNKTGGPTSLTLPQVLQGTILQYKATSGIWYALNDNSAIAGIGTTKGDSLLFTAAGTLVRQAAGTNGQVEIMDSSQATGRRMATPTLPTEHVIFNGASQLSVTPNPNVLVGAPQQITGCQLRIDASAYTQVQHVKYQTTGGVAGTKIRPQYWTGAAWVYLESSGTALELAADTNDTGPVTSGWVSTNLDPNLFVETLFRLVWYATGAVPTAINSKTLQLMFK